MKISEENGLPDEQKRTKNTAVRDRAVEHAADGGFRSPEWIRMAETNGKDRTHRL